MIFVTLGNHYQPFNRLLKELDNLAKNKIIDDVFVQAGYSDYQLKYCAYQKFIGFNNFASLIKKSVFVITHAGAGSIINILSLNKPAVVVPRLCKYGEHTNDHQLQITRALYKQGKIIPVFDIKKLDIAIKKAEHFKAERVNNSSNVINMIQEQIDLWF